MMNNIVLIKQITLFVILIIPIILVLYLLYKMALKKAKIKQMLFEQRLNDPRQRELVLLEQKEKVKKVIRILKYLKIWYIFLGLLLIIIGSLGVYYFFDEYNDGGIQKVLHQYNYQYYFASPIMVIFGIFMLVKNLKAVINWNKENIDM